MYKLVSRLRKGRRTVGYRVLDLSSGFKYDYDVSEFRTKVLQGLVKDVSLSSDGSLKGLSGVDLRTLKSEQIFSDIKIKSSDLFIRTGKQLKKHCDNVLVSKKPRFIVEKVLNYIRSNTESKICILYGLRRTGKTVMMLHAIQKLNCYSQCMYISCKSCNTMNELYDLLNNLSYSSKCKYVFIDEITALRGFYESSAILADGFAGSGMHIVIAGTDSMMLWLSSLDPLFDRYIGVDTTYISFREYFTLMSSPSVDVYLTDGGIFPRGVDYHEYMETAVIDNITNALVKVGNKRVLKPLMELNSRGILSKAINYVIMNLTFSGFTNDFKDRNLYSARQLTGLYNIGDTFFEDINELMRYSLGIYNIENDLIVENDCIEDLKDLFIKLDLIKEYELYINGRARKSYLIVQPFLKFYQARILVDILFQYDKENRGSRSDFISLRNKVMQDVKGLILEDCILLNELNRGSHELVTQYSKDNKEVDMLVLDSDCSIYLYEIKNSTKVVDGQCRYLCDDSFIEDIESYFGGKVRDKSVIYMGENKKVCGIGYINAQGFLLRGSYLSNE